MSVMDGAEREAAVSLGIVERRVGRRLLLTGIAALGAAGALGATSAASQDDSTPPGTDDDDTGARPEIGEAYTNFVEKLAANLGAADVAAVDAAIRDALAAMVEERFAAGEISRNHADELIERIQTADAPLGGILGRGMRQRRRKRRKNRGNDSDTSGADGSDRTALRH